MGDGRAVGIDIGGTKIAVATVNGAGEVLRESTIPTDSRQGFASGLGRITETVTRVLADTGWTARELDGVGIGCAGPVDPVRGTIHNPHTLPGWMDADIVSPLREAFGCPVVLENDADMALLGECRTGAGRGFDPVVMLTFGTGIGGVAGPWLFGELIGTGERVAISWGYALGAALMLAAAAIQWRWGLVAERRSLEDIAAPLSRAD